MKISVRLPRWSLSDARWVTVCALVLIICISLNPCISSTSEDSVLKRIEKASKPYDPTTVKAVQLLANETVVARDRDQRGAFKVLARKRFIERYPCSSCHNDKQVQARNGVVLTHGSITINHGQEGNSLSCIDCHHQDDRNALANKKGEKIDFDHSYLLCGQCHFRQKRDWLGGAHGKRVTYWAGERVVANCTTCHNPHAPRFEKRFPATYSPPAE